MLERRDFENCIQELETFYNGTILNGGILEAAWYESLKHLSLPRLQNAIARCFKKHPRAYNFFPSSGQILEFAQGEYRPPGECVMGDFSLKALPSHEQRLTPDQIAQLNKRGRLMARIIMNSRGWMTPEKKEQLIEQLKIKETHELEAIASTSARVPRRAKFNNLGGAIKNLEQELGIAESVVDESDVDTLVQLPSYDARAVARQWLQEGA